jgi:hypothetical protein
MPSKAPRSEGSKPFGSPSKNNRLTSATCAGEGLFYRLHPSIGNLDIRRTPVGRGLRAPDQASIGHSPDMVLYDSATGDGLTLPRRRLQRNQRTLATFCGGR